MVEAIILRLSMVEREKKMSKILLRLPKVMQKTGLKRATIYLHIKQNKQNKLPKQFKIGQQAVAWLESDIDAWIDEHLAKMEEEL